MPRLRLITAPYDSGHAAARHGAGPLRLMGAGAARALQSGGWGVASAPVEIEEPFPAEIATSVEVMRRVAVVAADALDHDEVPVLLAGNCGATTGLVAAHASRGRRVGVLWLDAHGDLHTPDTTTTGFFDGMGLALLTGRCWEALARTIPGFAPVPDEQVALVGGHRLDADELALIAGSALTHLSPPRLRTEDGMLDAVLGAIDPVGDGIHLHIDLDVHDTSVGAANTYARPGGLQAEEVQHIVRRAAEIARIRSATLASWDPGCDDGRMEAVALDLLAVIGRAAARG